MVLVDSLEDSKFLVLLEEVKTKTNGDLYICATYDKIDFTVEPVKSMFDFDTVM